MKISHSIFLSFVFILLLFSITTFINYQLSRAVTDNSEYFSRSTSIVRYSSRFQRNILTMVNGLRGYLLTGEKGFIESYDTASNENESILAELTPLLTDSSQKRLLGEIKTLNDQWTDEYTDPLKRAKMTSGDSPDDLDTFNRFYRAKYLLGGEKKILSELQQKFKVFTAYEYDLRETRGKQLAHSVSRTRKISITLTAVSVITAFLVIGLLVRRISRRIGRITGMANTIAAGNYDVSIPDKGSDELSSLSRSFNHMATELAKNVSLLKRSNEELDQFAHIVSHDMKGPLRGISNVIGWIEEDHQHEVSAKVHEYFGLIKGRIHRAENLIEGLLAYARTDKEELEKEIVDVNLLIEEVVGNLPGHNELNIEVGPMPVIQTEKLLLFQVFSNLIGNAIKYNDKEQPHVKVYYTQQANAYEFFIEDNGMGISEAYHKRIFTIFQTLADRDSFESTGVGLAIVKKILDSKQQQITLVSEPGKGSVFSFTWPK